MKRLLEKKNLLIQELDSMLEDCQREVRSLTSEENAVYEAKENELRTLNETIKKLQNKGELEMEKQIEVRNYEEELRAITTSTHSNTVPEGLASDIVRKLEEKSQVVAEANKVTYTGDYAVLQEGAPLMAEVLGETEDAQPKDLSNFTKVVLKDKRISVVTTVSKNVLHNSPIVGINYISEKVSQAVANKLEHEAFVADGTEKHLTKGLITGGKLINGNVTLENMMEVLTDMNPIYLNGSKWFVNRETFKELSKMMNANKQPYLALDVANQTPVYKFLGLPVVITDSVDCVVLANVGQALTLKLSQNSQIQVLNELYATTGQIGFICDFYGDMAVTNPDAVRVLKAASKSK
ncbi:phage major capsid protein [Clostridium sp.]|uniref:phage major capsid protein n=1 Tax=Clostridium sp. TaxID=1506 RepID=UPI0025BF2C78|nr:phage major capsid protein [Clostridium sp.]